VPLYEYRCTQCGHQFEKIQSFSSPELKECPVCKGEVERLLSAPAIQFKGAGWYVNDYAGKNGSSKPKSGSSTDSSSPASGESTPAKSESAPASSTPAAKSE
jgi:putative FmdB family regulatory protein